MSNIINKNEFIKNKVILMILSPILTFFMFFIMGNWSIVTINTSNVKGLSKVTILENCFSMSVLDILFLYLIIALVVGIMFRDKEFVLKGIVDKEVKRRNILITKIALCLAPLLISIVVNLVVKLITYLVIKNSVIDVIGITIGSFFLFAFYTLSLTLLILSIVFMLNIAVKQAWIATLIPLFIYNGVILIFGIAPFFISNKFAGIAKTIEPISNYLLNSLQLVFLNSALPVNELGRQYIVILILFAIALLVFYICYIMLDLLNKNNIKKIYVFSPIRHIYYLTLAAIIGVYTVCGLGYIYLISETTYDYNQGLFYINLMSFATVVVLYAALNLIYKYRTEDMIIEDGEAIQVEESRTEHDKDNEFVLQVEDNEFIVEEELDDEEEMKKLLIVNDEEEKDSDIIVESIQYQYEIEVESNDNIELSNESVKEILLDEPIKEIEDDGKGEQVEIEEKEVTAQEETLAEKIYANYIASLSDEKIE